MTKDLRTSYRGRREFERGASLLKERIVSGTISFSSHLEFLAGSLTRVQMLPNGRLNLDTVDEFVRSNFHILVANPFDRLHETEE